MGWTVVGLLVIAAIAWEVFSDLFHPGGTGALSDWIGRSLFNAFKRAPRFLPLAGPLAVIAVIGAWVGGLILGFALIYLPRYPVDFRTSTGAVPPGSSPVRSVIYFSYETLITLGYGDVVPNSATVRFASATEGLVGFGLLTASVSSIVLLYPALSRMRTLARGVEHLVEAESRCGLSLAQSDSDVIFSGLAREVTRARIDLVHFPMVYYFVSRDPKALLSRWTRDLVRMAREGEAPQRLPRVRLAAKTLDVALSELAALLDERFLHTRSGDRDAIFAALARDHLVEA